MDELRLFFENWVSFGGLIVNGCGVNGLTQKLGKKLANSLILLQNF